MREQTARSVGAEPIHVAALLADTPGLAILPLVIEGLCFDHNMIRPAADFVWASAEATFACVRSHLPPLLVLLGQRKLEVAECEVRRIDILFAENCLELRRLTRATCGKRAIPTPKARFVRKAIVTYLD